MLKKLTIKTKLSIMILIPLILILMQGVKVNYLYLTNLLELNRLEQAVNLSIKFGALIDEAQKERALTAGYIGSKGKKFVSELATQREVVNEKKSDVDEFLKTFNRDDYNKVFLKQLDSTLEGCKEVNNFRSNYDNFKFPKKEPLGYFTEVDNKMLTTIGEISKLSTNALVTQKINSYLLFMVTKEDAGIERALISSSFSMDKFPPEAKSRFVGLLANQKAYLNMYYKISDNPSMDFAKGTVVGEDVKEVARLRKIALSKIEGFGVDPAYWFKVSTNKIILLKKVEDYLSNRLIETIETESNKATTYLIIVGVATALGFVIVLLLSFFITKDILKNISRLKVGIDDFFKFINHEREDCNLIETDSQCELGQISRSVNENILKTKENTRVDNEMIEETIKVVEEVKKGYLHNKINASSHNPVLNKQKDIINEMFTTVNSNISRIIKVLNSYAKLDYRPRIDNSGLQGELNELVNDVNILRDSITEALTQNKKEGLLLQQKSNSLSQMMNNLSSSANNQAASLEETAAAIEEITGNISNNTNTTMQMASYGVQVKDSVNAGNEFANKTATAMDEIYEQSATITEAIEVIDQIAFQTNILSLNAAVEAATAGEAGKGFAVVAAEVRNLASRSAEAAKQIKEIVEVAQNKASEGKEIASQMINGYQELNQNITNTIDLIDDVNIASKEQQQGISQINDAVNGLDKETQENAQNASSANQIAIETSQISNMIIENVDEKEFEGKDNIVVS